jgi:dTDP-4-dehydrorhamnose reductase
MSRLAHVSAFPRGIPALAPDTFRRRKSASIALDLLIDGERGIWHLANPGQIEAGEFWRTLGSRSRLHFKSSGPNNYALDSERGQIMPSLDDALARYLDASNSGRDEERFRAAAE